MKYLLLLVVLCAGIVGCATGPDFKSYSSSLTPPKEGQARVWFYRPSKFIGSAVQPTVFLNEAAVGKAQPGCFFYTDRRPGTYTVQCTTEWSDKAQLTVNANEVHYVRLTMLPGVWVGHVLPKIVPEKDGLKEIVNCRLISADGMNKDLKPSDNALPQETKQ